MTSKDIKQEQRVYDGIRVIEFGNYIQGPYLTQRMADMGAEVIKVERPKVGDPTRGAPYILGKDISGNFIQRNCGKKSISLDLKCSEAIEIVKHLVRISDVVVENYRPGVMARLGLDYPMLRVVNPKIIVCSLSGFGQYGPYVERSTGDTLIQAMTLGMEMTGDPNGPPQMCGVAYVDFSTGAHGLAAIGGALFYREKTGIGQHIDLALFDTAFGMHESAIEEYLCSGGNIKYTRFGLQKKDLVPVGVFKGRDGYLAVAAPGDDHWVRLAKVMGRIELATDERYDTQIHRVDHRDEVVQLVTEWINSFGSIVEADRLLTENGIPSAPVLTIEQLMNDSQLEARGLVVEIEQPNIGKIRVVNSPFKFSETEAGIRGYAPRLGEHNDEVLINSLGYSRQQVADLYRNEVLYSTDVE